MKAAFSFWEDRIAPLFDVSEHLKIVEIDDGRVAASEEDSILVDTPAQRALWLAERSISLLVCGAVSRQLLALLSAYGIEVRPFVSGSIDSVIDAWLAGALDTAAFSMPGCPWRAVNGISRGSDGEGGSGMDAGAGGRRGGGTAGGRRGAGARGPSGSCVCTACGHTEPHERGIPCQTRKCPRCGAPMTRM